MASTNKISEPGGKHRHTHRESERHTHTHTYTHTKTHTQKQSWKLNITIFLLIHQYPIFTYTRRYLQKHVNM